MAVSQLHMHARARAPREDFTLLCFVIAGTAPVVPFMPTLARQLGFSTVVVGTVYTILPIIGLLVKPLFGFVADR